MQWKEAKNESTLSLGSILRVRVGCVFHYGVYVGDDLVVQFGSAEELPCPDPKRVRVCTCSVAQFGAGEAFSIGICTPTDPRPFAPEQIARRARARIGEDGYDFVKNNCEHFVCECVFDRHIAPETERFSALFERLPKGEVYVAPIPFPTACADGIFPTERRREIEEQKNPHVRCQKFFAWRLLEYAARSSYGIKLADAKICKEPSGKWRAEEFCFSLSHSKVLVAAAVSKLAVGVDAEHFVPERFNEKLARHILTDREKASYAALSPEKKSLFVACAWTGKESVFKRGGGTVFRPNQIEAFYDTSFRQVSLGDETYVLSISAHKADRFRLISFPQSPIPTAFETIEWHDEMGI